MNRLTTKEIIMTATTLTAIQNNVPTTFHRIMNGLFSSTFNNNLTQLSSPTVQVRPTNRNIAILDRTSYTNFKLKTPESGFEEMEELFLEDMDFYMPLRPKKSFKIKAKITSVKKFRPKPFFDQ